MLMTEEPGGMTTQPLKTRPRRGAKGSQPLPIKSPSCEENDGHEGQSYPKKMPTPIPPGEPSVTMGPPDNSIPTMEGLWIEQHCDVGGLELVDEENSNLDPSDSEFGFVKDELAPMAQSRKQKEKHTCNV
jgi:hypothetical protein